MASKRSKNNADVRNRDRLIMAIDTLQKPTQGLKYASKTMMLLAHGLDLKVQPVSVLSPDQLRWPQKFNESWRQEFKLLGESAMSETLAKMKITPQIRPEVVMQFSHSLRSSAKAILEYADQSGVGAIGVITHIRKKAAATFPGGFVEAVTAGAKVPVIAVHAEASVLTKIRTVLIPTDFSEGSERIFDLAVKTAKAFGAKVVIFHAMPNPMDSHWFSSSSLVGGWERVEAILEQEEKATHEEARNWIEKAAKEGVPCEFLLTHSRGGVSDGVLRASRKIKADLIVMAAHTGPVMSYFLGSVMRDVLMRSLTPVIIVRD